MRFQNVSFEGCSVLVLAGAKATLDSCPATDANVFLVASGAHTQVSLPLCRSLHEALLVLHPTLITDA